MYNYDYWVVKINADGSKAWDKPFGSDQGVDELRSVIRTADNGYLLGGYSLSYGAGGDKTEDSRGNSDFWIIKINADGSKVWDKTLGGSGYEYLNTLIQTADGGYLVGGASTTNIGGEKTEHSRGGFDFWVVKLNADGSKAWDRTIGGGDGEILESLIATPDGGYLLGGTSNSGIGGDKTENNRGTFGDYWVVKLNADGSKAWDKTFGGSNEENLMSLATTSDGGYLLGGISYSGSEHDRTGSSKGLADYWVVKINSEGNKIWDKAFGGSDYDYLISLVETEDRGYLLGGTSLSDVGGDKTENNRGILGDYWVVKINSEGSKVWDKTFGGSHNEEFMSLIKTADGGYLLGGITDSGTSGEKSEANRGSFDYWVVKIQETVTTSIGELKQESNRQFLVYPNPGNGSLKIKLYDPKLGTALVALVLYNTLGQQVLSETLTGSDVQVGAILNTSTLPNGTYYLHLQVQEKILKTKIVINEG